MIHAYDLDSKKQFGLELDFSKNFCLLGKSGYGKKTLFRHLIEKNILENKKTIFLVSDNQKFIDNVEYFCGFNDRTEDILFFYHEKNQENNRDTYLIDLFGNRTDLSVMSDRIDSLFSFVSNKIIIVNSEDLEVSNFLLNNIYKSFYDEKNEEETILFVEKDYLFSGLENSIFSLNKLFPISTIGNFEQHSKIKEFDVEKLFFYPAEYKDLEVLSNELYLSNSEIEKMEIGFFYYNKEGKRLINSFDIRTFYETDFQIAELKAESIDIPFTYFDDKELNDMFVKLNKKFNQDRELEKLLYYGFKTIQYFRLDKEPYISSDSVLKLEYKKRIYEPQYILDNIDLYRKINIKQFILDTLTVALKEEDVDNFLLPTISTIFHSVSKSIHIKFLINLELFIDIEKLIEFDDKNVKVDFIKELPSEYIKDIIKIFDLNKEDNSIEHSFIDRIFHKARNIEIELFKEKKDLSLFSEYVSKEREDEEVLRNKELESLKKVHVYVIDHDICTILEKDEVKQWFHISEIESCSFEYSKTTYGNKIIEVNVLFKSGNIIVFKTVDMDIVKKLQ